MSFLPLRARAAYSAFYTQYPYSGTPPPDTTARSTAKKVRVLPLPQPLAGFVCVDQRGLPKLLEHGYARPQVLRVAHSTQTCHKQPTAKGRWYLYAEFHGAAGVSQFDGCRTSFPSGSHGPDAPLDLLVRAGFKSGTSKTSPSFLPAYTDSPKPVGVCC